MRFESKFQFTSKSCEGVSATLRRLNNVGKAKLDLQLLEARSKYSRFKEGLDELPEQPEGKTVSVDRARLMVQMDAVIAIEIKAGYLKAGIIKLEGLDIDGVPATVETLISDGPDDLINEIYLAVAQETGLTEDQEKNSQSPTTSQPAEEAGESTTSAESASSTDATTTATAASTSPET